MKCIRHLKAVLDVKVATMIVDCKALNVFFVLNLFPAFPEIKKFLPPHFLFHAARLIN